MLASTLVLNADTIRAFNRVDRNRDYRIEDVEVAVSQVMSDLVWQLSPNGCSPSRERRKQTIK